MFARKVFVATIIPLAVVLVVLLVARVSPVLLTFFIGVLLALFLRAGGDLVAHVTHLPTGWSLTIFVVVLGAVTGVFGWLAVPQIVTQLDALVAEFPEALKRAEDALGSVPWFETVIRQIPETIQSSVEARPGWLDPLRALFSATVGIIVGIAVLFAVGVYLAVRPSMYVDAFVLLFPVGRRDRMKEVLGRLAHVLRMWLVGRAIGMAFVGLLTALGLFLLGVPLPLALGFIAAILDFVPNIGPLLAAVPAVLIALTEGPQLALYVVVLYIAVQELEAYLVVPMIEQRVVSLAPAFNVIFQVILAILFGFLGLLLATPLMVVMMVLIQELYIKDVLERPLRRSV